MADSFFDLMSVPLSDNVLDDNIGSSAVPNAMDEIWTPAAFASLSDNTFSPQQETRGTEVRYPDQQDHVYRNPTLSEENPKSLYHGSQQLNKTIGNDLSTLKPILPCTSLTMNARKAKEPKL